MEIDPTAGLSTFFTGAQFRRLSFDTVLNFIFSDRIYELRRISLVGLGYTKNVEALDYLLKDSPLRDDDDRIRAAATLSLGVIGRGKALPDLIKMLEYESYLVRWQVCKV